MKLHARLLICCKSLHASSLTGVCVALAHDLIVMEQLAGYSELLQSLGHGDSRRTGPFPEMLSASSVTDASSYYSTLRSKVYAALDSTAAAVVLSAGVYALLEYAQLLITGYDLPHACC